jgi:hypothetical protein
LDIILYLAHIKQDGIAYFNNNNIFILSNVWIVNYIIYYFLNRNLKVVLKYKVMVKYKNTVLFLICITIKQTY